MASDSAERRVALIVATNTYADGTLQALAAPAADAEALAQVLGDVDLGGFEVEALLDGKHYEVAERVEAVLSEASTSDLVLLHFSCHGIKNDSGELFLAAANTKATRLESTALKTVWLNGLMRRSRAKRVVLFLDCCFGGAFDRGYVPRADTAVHLAEQLDQRDLGGGRGHVVITASSATEYALEGGELSRGGKPQPSVFTRSLVEGLATGDADRDQDGLVDLNELYDYVYDRVRAITPKQTPERSSYGQQGSLYIARNARRQVRAAPLPEDLKNAVIGDDKLQLLGAIRTLDQLASGDDLPIAAGAAQALQQLADHDRRSVAEDATKALVAIRPTLASTTVDLGTVAADTDITPIEIDVQGPPIALASVVTTSTPGLRASIRGDVLVISGRPQEMGRVQTTVVLTGAAGEATLTITAEVTQEAFGTLDAAAAAGGFSFGTQDAAQQLVARREGGEPDPDLKAALRAVTEVAGHGTGEGHRATKSTGQDLILKINVVETPTEWILMCDSPAGGAVTRVPAPFTADELRAKLLELEASVFGSYSKIVTRRTVSPEATALHFGNRLADILLGGEVRVFFEECRRRARESGGHVRLLLETDGRTVSQVPWEFAVDPRGRDDYLALHLSFARHLRVAAPVPPLNVKPPLRVLGMHADPHHLLTLTIEEKQQSVAALQSVTSDLVQVTWLEGDRWSELSDALGEGGWHVLHFVGPGGYNEETGSGYLELSDDSGAALPVSAARIGAAAANSGDTRLVSLNTSESATTGAAGPLTSMAAKLMREGIPAAVAMQYEITDPAALAFAAGLYEALARGNPVDRAATKAREIVRVTQNSLEWATPVLFLASDETRLYDVVDAPATSRHGGHGRDVR